MKRITCIAIVVLALAESASACPSCSDSVNTPVEATATVASYGFNAAIWLMLSAAGLGMTTVAGVLAMSLRARDDRQTN